MKHLFQGTRRRQSNFKEAIQVKKINVPGGQINGPDLILFTAAKKSRAQVFHHRKKTKRDGA